MNKNKVFALGMSAVMALSMVGCANNPTVQPDVESPAPSGEPEISDYYTENEGFAAILEKARTAEDNEYFPVETELTEDMENLILPMLGIEATDMDSFAIAVSAMNVKAYGVALIKPAEGKEETVRAGLEQFVANQQQSFEHYLEDQYEIAMNAKVETLSDGTIALVMCEDAESVLTSLEVYFL